MDKFVCQELAGGIKIQGVVLALKGHIGGRKELANLVLQTNEGQRTVDVPIKTRSAFELIPYQLALIGENVRYSKKSQTWEEGVMTEFKLEVLSGKLEGSVYKTTNY